jgi:four helix bundle protein
VWGGLACSALTRKNACQRLCVARETILDAVTVLSLGVGMQAKPPHATFQVLDVAVEAIEVLAPVVARIRRCDRDLGEQIRRALSSVALNTAEGNRSEGGVRLSRFSTAAGSNAESRAALRVAVAWGYVEAHEVAAGDARLDRVAAMLHRLGARR